MKINSLSSKIVAALSPILMLGISACSTTGSSFKYPPYGASEIRAEYVAQKGAVTTPVIVTRPVINKYRQGAWTFGPFTTVSIDGGAVVEGERCLPIVTVAPRSSGNTSADAGEAVIEFMVTRTGSVENEKLISTTFTGRYLNISSYPLSHWKVRPAVYKTADGKEYAGRMVCRMTARYEVKAQ